MGCSDPEACLYAGIGVRSLYRYEEKNPEFRQRKHLLKENLKLKSRALIAKAIEKDKDLREANWYMERKAKDEFGQRTEITGKGGESLKMESKRSKDEKKELSDVFVLALETYYAKARRTEG